MWEIIWYRYRAYIYLIPAIASVAVAIYAIKTFVTPGDQLWVATAYIVILFGTVVFTVPYNIYIGSRRRFYVLESADTPLSFDLAVQAIGDFDITKLDPILVEDVLVPREECILPLDAEYDFSRVLPKIGKSRFVALRYHLSFEERVDTGEGEVVVFFRGTPFNSVNAEKLQGYFSDTNLAEHRNEYGPMPIFEVTSTTYGDAGWLDQPTVLDRAFAERVRIRDKRRSEASRIEEAANGLKAKAPVPLLAGAEQRPSLEGLVFQDPTAEAETSAWLQRPMPTLEKAEFYCVKERRKVLAYSPERVELKNGKHALSSRCPSCGTKLSKFVKAEAT